MTDSPTPEPLFLACAPDPAFATVHRPAAPRSGAGVLLCPPFGWEEVCSYRSLRRWAERLAAAGHVALRLSLPGTGDSGGGPRDPGRLEAWTAAVTAGAGWLRGEGGATRVVAVGIGLGGLLACRAAAAGAAIDDLVLWGTPARGRPLIRQLRAFSALERSQVYQGLGDPPAPAAGELESGGFVLTAETLAAIEALDLRGLELPDPAARRALLLDRDGLSADAAVRARLEELGVAVSGAPGEGYADMTSHPQTARPPAAVIERVEAWLAEGAATTAVTAPAAVTASPSAELRAGPGDERVRETVLSIPGPHGRLAAILTEPLTAGAPDPDAPCVVLLNAGAVRRIGPSRMWVEAARRWAAAGVPVLRLDVEGIGDADGDETPYSADAALYTPRFVPQVTGALDFLAARGTARRFVLGGLCSGAYWSLHAALGDERVTGLLLLNPRLLIWADELGPARDLRALLTRRHSLAKLRRLATGPRLRELLRWLAGAPLRLVRRRRSAAAGDAQRELHARLDRLIATGRPVLWLFSENEPLHDELRRSGRLDQLAAAPNVTVEHVRIRDHTMRPGWAQREVHRALDAALGIDTPARP